MRNFEAPGRSLAASCNGMAATSHILATLAAVDMLQKGGNAMDAAVTACAVQCVVEPGSTGIGGDCFVLYAPEGSGDIVAFNGSGRAPGKATQAWYAKQGMAEIPRASPHAVTIPGAVDAWSQLLARHGTRELSEVLQPAIRLAFEGYAITPRVNLDWSEQQELLSADPVASRMLLVDGKAPAVGTRHRQPELAETLKRIAKSGRDAFYAGAVAEDMVERLQSLGGLHTIEDFKTARGEFVAPIKTGFRGYDVYECPPNGQGIIALLILNILAGFRPEGDPMALERLHVEIEATRLAYSVRNAFLADPALASVPGDWMLSGRLADDLRKRIEPGRMVDPLPKLAGPAHNDTVYITVVDKDRNSASFINSTFHTFGSGIVAPRSGVVLQNRGMSFSLDARHPNVIAPGKRPLHTIIPAMLVKDGRAQMPFGVMGGDYQAMGHASFLARVLDYGLDLQEAMDLPRVFPEPGTRSLQIEGTLKPETQEGLAKIGYELKRMTRPIGGSQAIWIDWANGTLIGGSDPRKDGGALGY